MRYSELTRRLRRLGFHLIREGARHELWGKPGTDLSTVIPGHRGEEVPRGTLHQIRKDLELERDEL